jgi:uncharacterized protein YxjI
MRYMIREKFFHLGEDSTIMNTVDIPGPDHLETTESLFEHAYTISRAGQVVAVVSKRWFSLTETYGVDIAPGQDDPLILACVLALELAEDREHLHD